MKNWTPNPSALRDGEQTAKEFSAGCLLKGRSLLIEQADRVGDGRPQPPRVRSEGAKRLVEVTHGERFFGIGAADRGRISRQPIGRLQTR